MFCYLNKNFTLEIFFIPDNKKYIIIKKNSKYKIFLLFYLKYKAFLI